MIMDRAHGLEDLKVIVKIIRAVKDLNKIVMEGGEMYIELQPGLCSKGSLNGCKRRLSTSIRMD